MQSYDQLQELYKYLKKAINTRLTSDLLRQKEKLNHKLKADIENYLQEEYNNIKDVDFHTIAKNTRHWHVEIQKIIKHKLEILNLHTTVHKNTHTLSGIAKTTTAYEHTSTKLTQISPKKINKQKMAPPSFDMKQATAIVPMYDGTPDDLDAFIDAISLLAEVTAEENKATAVKFIKTRLTKKARLGLPKDLASIEAIATDLKARCKGQDQPEAIIAKLKQVKKKSSLNEFCEEIENLTLKLKSLYMEQQVPVNIANSMATRVGLDSLINGIPSNETKIILKAGSFTDIKQAIQKVNENTDVHNAQVLMTNSRQQFNRYANNGNRNNTNNNTYRNEHRFIQNNSYQRDRNNYHRGNGGQRHFSFNAQRNNQNNNNYYSPRQPHGNRHNRGNLNNQQTRRVYTGSAAQVAPSPESPSQVQYMMNQPNLTYPTNATANQLRQPQQPEYNFLGQAPHT